MSFQLPHSCVTSINVVAWRNCHQLELSYPHFSVLVLVYNSIIIVITGMEGLKWLVDLMLRAFFFLLSHYHSRIWRFVIWAARSLCVCLHICTFLNLDCEHVGILLGAEALSFVVKIYDWFYLGCLSVSSFFPRDVSPHICSSLVYLVLMFCIINWSNSFLVSWYFCQADACIQMFDAIYFSTWWWLASTSNMLVFFWYTYMFLLPLSSSCKTKDF